jgi:pyocin large subunit-like protein
MEHVFTYNKEQQPSVLEYVTENIKELLHRAEGWAYDVAIKIEESLERSSVKVKEVAEVMKVAVKEGFDWYKQNWAHGQFNHPFINMVQHYVKHKHEFDGCTFKEYVEIAKQEIDLKNLDVFRLEGMGDNYLLTYVYNEKSNTFVVLNDHGKFVTMYKPNPRKRTYLLEQNKIQNL